MPDFHVKSYTLRSYFLIYHHIQGQRKVLFCSPLLLLSDGYWGAPSLG